MFLYRRNKTRQICRKMLWSEVYIKMMVTIHKLTLLKLLQFTMVNYSELCLFFIRAVNCYGSYNPFHKKRPLKLEHKPGQNNTNLGKNISKVKRSAFLLNLIV